MGREYDTETSLFYYRARYYDSSIGRFISEDPTGFNGGLDFYAYGENDPINLIDPWGLRDIIVVIWNQKGSSVGHAGAFETNSDPILSQFPKECHCPEGTNIKLSWPDTLKQEGRNPDRIFRVHVPNDKAFGKVAENHRKRPVWNWYPMKIEIWETNCVFAVTRALKAGRVVPMPDYDLAWQPWRRFSRKI
jgi:RHS repeat-associated protein